MSSPTTTYVESAPDTHVAYHVIGDATPDLLLVWGFISHLELAWDHPGIGDMLRRLSRFARVINFDKRGMGMSDPVPSAPTLEDRVEDALAVLDAVGSDRSYLLGLSEGVPASLLFAAAHPERVAGLVLYGGMARSTWSEDHPWAAPPEALRAANREFVGAYWGEGAVLDVFGPSVADDDEARSWQARMERNAAPPGVVGALFDLFLEIDVRELVPNVHVPTLVIHRRGDRAVNVRASRWLADRLPNAELVELPGADHQPWSGDSEAIYERIERFVTGTVVAAPPTRRVETLLFTDISRSTELATERGDGAWRALLGRHDGMVRGALARHAGREVKTLGDGFLAAFDGPARAVRCALEIVATGRGLGLEIRAGLHTGECEVSDGDVTGVAVHIAARVVGLAEPGEVLTTDTVRTLVIGSGLAFRDRGEHELRGVPGSWRLAAVETGVPSAGS